jgi:hypothetical protein
MGGPVRRAALAALWLLPTLAACGDGAGPDARRAERPAACAPIFFASTAQTRYYLTAIDGASLPQPLALPGGRLDVAAGQLALDTAGTDYLLAFFAAAAGRLAGASVVLGQGAARHPDGSLALFVGGDPARVRGTATVEADGAAARVTTADAPALGPDNLGAHDFRFTRCP